MFNLHGLTPVECCGLHTRTSLWPQDSLIPSVLSCHRCTHTSWGKTQHSNPGYRDPKGVSQVCVFPWVFLPNTGDQPHPFSFPTSFFYSIYICKQIWGHIKARSHFFVPPSLSDNPLLLVTWVPPYWELGRPRIPLPARKHCISRQALGASWGSEDKTPIPRSSHPPNFRIKPRVRTNLFFLQVFLSHLKDNLDLDVGRWLFLHVFCML